VLRRRPLSRALLLALLPAAALAAPVTYELDPAKTELLAFTQPSGLFKGASHSHLLEARQVTGKLVYDAEKVGASSVTVSFPVDALVNDDPAMRKREAMTSMLNEADRKSVAASLRGESQLNQKHWPQISFDSTAVTSLGEGKLEVTGRFGVRGAKKELKLPVTFSVKDGVFTGEGSVTFTHRDIGMAPFVAVLGTVRNAEEIRLKVKLVGKAKAAAPPEAAR